MITALLLTTAMLTKIAPECSWDHPGVNPFQGNVAEAVDHYKDIPADIRAVLKRRIAQQQPDEVVDIGRDRIIAKADYAPEIRDMHFGAASLCRNITRSKWRSDHLEPATVYCEQDQCVIIPRICNNLSRITRRQPARHEPAVAVAPATPGPADEGGTAVPEIVLPASLSSGGGDGAGLAGGDGDGDGAIPSGLGVVTGTADDDWHGGGGCGRHFPTCTPDSPQLYAPVPEPDAWAMLLSGAALIAWLARRRQRISQLKYGE
ncbi:MHFG family PEP-CTERM protein [Duganella sp. BuS-21]|uniref:MHFG family PEP-CTERM protein n=1 Tax=Duganella sp. BuS-21 TaxID=2943848 RepID=UPI0035A71B91